MTHRIHRTTKRLLHPALSPKLATRLDHTQIARTSQRSSRDTRRSRSELRTVGQPVAPRSHRSSPLVLSNVR